MIPCPSCGSMYATRISCGCDDINCQDILDCNECHMIFNMGK